MKITTNVEQYKNDIFDMYRAFYPLAELDDNAPEIFHTFSKENNLVTNSFVFKNGKEEYNLTETTELENYKNELEEKRYTKRAIKLVLYKLLAKINQKNLPWGSLTGIRPTKIGYELIESGVDPVFVKEVLVDKFLVSEPKAKLVANVIKHQKSIIKNDNLVDLYINIPFCPTKCSYCSFISSEYDKVKKIIPNYLDALKKEIESVKKIIQEKYYIVRSIYIGGGTPTVLSAEQLEEILSLIKYPVSEFTVECGRPDTITKEKLDVLSKYGVTRISINPQTFVEKTLKAIGRNHTTQDVINAYKLALNYDFCVNMDIIAGLPGETMIGFKKTIKTLLELAPDNITVHTLAIKKGSVLIEEGVEENQTTEQMVTYAQTMLQENDYKPYYLYKLKNQSMGLENVGFFRDKVCMFNIDSMEETCSVLACGANAISKRIYNLENRIERQANMKFACDYIANISQAIEKKRELFK